MSDKSLSLHADVFDPDLDAEDSDAYVSSNMLLPIPHRSTSDGKLIIKIHEHYPSSNFLLIISHIYGSTSNPIVRIVLEHLLLNTRAKLGSSLSFYLLPLIFSWFLLIRESSTKTRFYPKILNCWYIHVK